MAASYLHRPSKSHCGIAETFDQVSNLRKKPSTEPIENLSGILSPDILTVI